MNEEIESENLRIHSRADELIACLEGEIAERDARIDELESRYQRDVYGLNNEGDPIGGDPAGGYSNDNARLRAELAALKAQDTVGEVVGWYRLDRPYEMTPYPSVCATWHRLGAPVAPLYAAHAQQVSVPDGWRELAKAVTALDQVPRSSGHAMPKPEQVRAEAAVIRAARAMLNAAPAAPAVDAGLVEAEEKVRHQEQIIDRMGEDLNAINGPTFMGEPVIRDTVEVSRKAIQRLFKAAGCSGSVGNSEVLNAASDRLNAAPAQQAKCRTCDDNGRIGGPSFYAPDEGGEPCPDCSAPVQQVSVPECYARLLKHAFGMTFGEDWNRGTAAETHRNKLIEAVFDCRHLLAAAPAAPAADAGLVLEQAMYALIGIGYHENSGLVHELRQSLAAHRAKGVV